MSPCRHVAWVSMGLCWEPSSPHAAKVVCQFVESIIFFFEKGKAYLVTCFTNRIHPPQTEIHKKSSNTKAHHFRVFERFSLGGVFATYQVDPMTGGQLQVHAPPALLEHFSEDSEDAEVSF